MTAVKEAGFNDLIAEIEAIEIKLEGMLQEGIEPGTERSRRFIEFHRLKLELKDDLLDYMRTAAVDNSRKKEIIDLDLL